MTMHLLQLGRRQAWERNSPRPFCQRRANYGTAVTRHCTVIALEYGHRRYLDIRLCVRVCMDTYMCARPLDTE